VAYLKPVLRKMYSLTEQDGREHGFFVYENNGKIERTNIQTGMFHGISLRMKSIFGLGLFTEGVPLATFHSHPNEPFNFLFSQTDFKTLIDGNLEFAGVVYNSDNSPVVEVYSGKEYSSYGQLLSEIAHKYFQGQNTIPLVPAVEAMNSELRVCKLRL